MCRFVMLKKSRNTKKGGKNSYVDYVKKRGIARRLILGHVKNFNLVWIPGYRPDIA